MARFTKSNRFAAEDMAQLSLRSFETVQSSHRPTSDRDFGNFTVHPTSG
ncbi:MAG: hypothetical protein AAGK37_23145 [Pseudomonadota bacterium]